MRVYVCVCACGHARPHVRCARARVNASSSRNVSHTPCKLQRWSSALIHGSRNALIIPIIVHGFRHRGCLRAHPRCCHRLIVSWIGWNPIENGWGFNKWNFWKICCREFRILEPKINFFSGKKPIRYERWGGLVGWLGLWATFRHVCHCKKIRVPLVSQSQFWYLWK